MSTSSSYEVNFNRWLDPYKAMLASKRKLLTPDEWLDLVRRTRNSIIQNPEQYLGRDLPDSQIIQNVVTNIFNNFLESEKATAV